ncbi:hypothetical protein VQ056_06410 [Paenibacillus sp. JTLBN-2024]
MAYNPDDVFVINGIIRPYGVSPGRMIARPLRLNASMPRPGRNVVSFKILDGRQHAIAFPMFD